MISPGAVFHRKRATGRKGDVTRVENFSPKLVAVRDIGWVGQRSRLAAGYFRRGYRGVRKPFWTAIPRQAERDPSWGWPKRKTSEGFSVGTRFPTRRAALDALKAYEAIRREEYLALGIGFTNFTDKRAYRADRAAYIRYRREYDRGF